MGDDSLRGYYGRRNSRGRLAHHSHAWPPDGEIAAGARICGRDERRADYSRRQLLRHSSLHNTRDIHFDHGRGRGQTFQRHEMESRRANHLGMAFYLARKRPYRLCARTRGSGALISRNLSAQRFFGGSIPNFLNIFLIRSLLPGVSNLDSSGYSAQNSTSR